MRKTTSFVAASNLSTAKIKASAKDMAKGKKPSKAETQRRNQERAIASAKKALLNTTLDEARAKCVEAEGRADGMRDVFAMALNQRFAFTLDNKGHHWTAIEGSDNAKQADSNLHPVWKAIKDERDIFEGMLNSRRKPYSNSRQAWSRVKQRAFELAFPGKKREPRNPGKAPADKAMAKLVSAYKDVAKETIQTERDEQLVEAIGKLLIAFKIDLAEINRKIGG